MKQAHELLDDMGNAAGELRRKKHELARMKKSLRALSDDVKTFIILLDGEMTRPSDNLRGQRIAKMSNGLELKNDMVRRFSLGLRK